MDVEIGEMESVVNVVDSKTFLDPHVLEQIIVAVIARLKERHALETQASLDRDYKQSILGAD